MIVKRHIHFLLILTLKSRILDCSSRVTRVVDGSNAEIQHAPFIVSLQKSKEHYCAGSILNKHWVLTAGHCLIPEWRIARTILVAGSSYVNGKGRFTQKRKINYYVIHEKYYGDTKPYDFGLIYTKIPFKWNRAVAAISLTPPKWVINPTGNALVYGWGSTSTNHIPKYPSKLQKALVPIIPPSKCKHLLGEKSVDFHFTNICVGHINGTGSICISDSGGPLVQSFGKTHILIGVASWAKVPCGEINVPSIYGSVANFLKWISLHQVIPKNNKT